jgi:hypothetical protein
MPNEKTSSESIETPTTVIAAEPTKSGQSDESPTNLGVNPLTDKGPSPTPKTVLPDSDDVKDGEDDEDDEDETVIDALSKEVDKLKKKVFERKQKRTKKRRTTPKPKSKAWTLFG